MANPPEPNGATAGVLEFGLEGRSPARTIAAGRGQNPRQVAADAAGDLFVLTAESEAFHSHNALTEYAPDGKVLRTISGPSPYVNMTIDRLGDVFVANFAVKTGAILEYAPGAVTPSRRVVEGIDNPWSLGVDDALNFYVLNATQDEPSKGECQMLVTEYPVGATTPSREMRFPSKRDCNTMAVDAKQSLLYVISLKTVAVFSHDGAKPIRTITKGFTNPYALMVDRKGNLYVGGYAAAYGKPNLITEFAPNSTSPRRTFRLPPTAVVNGMNGERMAVDARGDLYVVVSELLPKLAAYTLEYSPSGQLLRTLKGLGNNATAVSDVP